MRPPNRLPPSTTDEGALKRGVPPVAKRVIMVALPLAVALWLALFILLPTPAEAGDERGRLGITLAWLAISALFCLGGGIEAVAHERLRSTAFDPMAGQDSHRLLVNQRYLQNTVEQFSLFAPGLLVLGYLSTSPGAFRAVPATAIVWIVCRFAFWIGYHRGSSYRAAGVPGLLIPLALLLYAAVRFGYLYYGLIGAAAPIALFGLLEAVLVLRTGPSSTPESGRDG